MAVIDDRRPPAQQVITPSAARPPLLPLPPRTKLATIADLYSPRERGRYQGLFGAVFGLSFIVGPFVGGWITDHISWHWVFYVNVPFGVAALAVVAIVLPSAGRRQASLRDLDYAGI